MEKERNYGENRKEGKAEGKIIIRRRETYREGKVKNREGIKLWRKSYRRGRKGKKIP